MLKFISKNIFGLGKKSKSAAKSRLHFVLVQDRTGLTNQELAGFRGELVEVIQRYFDIDEQGFDIDYEREGDTTRLVINSPVIVRRQDAQGKSLVTERVRANGGADNSQKNIKSGASSRMNKRDKRREKKKQQAKQEGRKQGSASSAVV